ncbi:UDP-N-acetylmuramoyl-L-alanine--D-glutamate ligase [Leptospira sp. 96542]|nr:UDP-N-acetylmuramoyl-L-alanine--D-glutamate ligase [Leptospira sp. 96542]
MFSKPIPDPKELLSYDNFLILGGGVSGESAANLLISLGKSCDLLDKSPNLTQNQRFRYTFSEEDFEKAIASNQVLIKSPGISPSHPTLRLARTLGIPILSEIALGRVFYKGCLVGITGTDGKSTTTALTHHIIKSKFPNSKMGGNIGVPFTQFCTEDLDLVVLELSSYQLEDSPNLELSVGVITNIATDHLERHITMENYLSAKWKISNLNEKNHHFILPDSLWEKMRQKIEHYDAKVLLFGSNDRSQIQVDFKNQKIISMDGEYDTKNFPLPGFHNLQNLSVAIGIAEVLGLSKEQITSQYLEFEGLPHRFKKLNKKDHNLYPNLVVINDSKSTNLHSMLSGLSGFSKEDKIYLILGGEPKGENFQPFFDRWKELNCEVWVYGKATKVWQSEFQEKILGCKFVPNPKEALTQIKTQIQLDANTMSQSATILFSPACASFDLYKNFSERGDDFENQIRKLFSTT